MKAIFPLFLLLTVTGCARALVRDFMQPDQSYRIEIDGNYYATEKDVHRVAHRRAEHLCPRGYDTAAEFVEQLEHANYVLIVTCKLSPPSRQDGPVRQSGAPGER
jgi:hypothetical protein